MDHPGLAKGEALDWDAYSTTRAKKIELDRLLVACGLHERGKRCEAARIIGVNEGTLRGWQDRRAMNRRPNEKALEKLRELAEFKRLNAIYGKEISA